jgi:signal transduction histidine kinase
MTENRIRSICIPVQTAIYRLIDVDRFYAMFYDKTLGLINFPLVSDEENIIPEGQLPWMERAWEERWLSDKALLQNMPTRLNHRSKYWPEGGEMPQSWLAVPVGIEENIRIALVVENWRRGDAFGDEAERFLTTIAQQAAMAIRNLRLYDEWKQEEEKNRSFIALRVMSDTAAEFAHRMNNLAGTIPIRVVLAKEKLNAQNSRDAMVIKQLDLILEEAEQILKAAQMIKESAEIKALENVSINDLVNIAIRKAVSAKPRTEERVQIKKHLSRNLPEIEVERSKLIDVLTSIIKNGLDAIADKGVVTITTSQFIKNDKHWLKIAVTDDGMGIPKENLSKIFDLFFTTKDSGGLGFGLWRDKTYMKELGGDIDVVSEISQGSTFTIKIPVSSGE